MKDKEIEAKDVPYADSGEDQLKVGEQDNIDEQKLYWPHPIISVTFHKKCTGWNVICVFEVLFGMVRHREVRTEADLLAGALKTVFIMMLLMECQYLKGSLGTGSLYLKNC